MNFAAIIRCRPNCYVWRVTSSVLASHAFTGDAEMFIRLTELVEHVTTDGEIICSKYRVMVPLSCIKYVTELHRDKGLQRLYDAGARTGIVWHDGTEARTIRIVEPISDFAKALE